jgi:hypothetical protein
LLRLAQLLHSDYLNCDIDKRTVKAVSCEPDLSYHDELAGN